MKKTLYNAFIGLMIGAAVGMGVSTTLLNQKHKKELEETQERLYQIGMEQGREDATSKLVSALNTATSDSLTSLHFRVRGTINDESLSGYPKVAIAGAYMHGINHLEDIRRIFNLYGDKLATGKIKIEKLQTKKLEIYGETTPANYNY